MRLVDQWMQPTSMVVVTLHIRSLSSLGLARGPGLRLAKPSRELPTKQKSGQSQQNQDTFTISNTHGRGRYFNTSATRPCHYLDQQWRAAVNSAEASPLVIRTDFEHLQHSSRDTFWISEKWGAIKSPEASPLVIRTHSEHSTGRAWDSRRRHPLRRPFASQWLAHLVPSN